MKPVAFRYERPESVEEAVELLREHGDEAKVLAGGQSLVPMLNMRLARPSVLVDVNRLPLGDVARDDGMLLCPEGGAVVAGCVQSHDCRRSGVGVAARRVIRSRRVVETPVAILARP